MQKADSRFFTSIIIPVYNGEKYIRRLLISLMNQTSDKFEIIIVDDGSTDSSREICKEYEDLSQGRIHLIEKENGGVSSARNVGLENAKGEIIIFCDADDYVEPEYVEKLTTALYDSDFVSSAYFRSKNGEIEEYGYAGKDITVEELIYGIFCYPTISGACWNKAFKRELIGEQRFHEDLSIGEDMLFISEYLKPNMKYAYINEPLYHYECNDESALQKQYKSKKLSPKVYTNINSAISIAEQLKKWDTTYTGYAAAYRKIRSCMWVYFQCVCANKYEKDVLIKIRNICREEKSTYLKFNPNGKIQKILLMLVCFSPITAFVCGRIAMIMFPSKIRKMLV